MSNVSNNLNFVPNIELIPAIRFVGSIPITVGFPLVYPRDVLEIDDKFTEDAAIY